MIESVQARQLGSKDFGTIYTHLCSLQDTCPLTSVKAHLGDGALDLNVDRIRLPDWTPIFNSLRINKTLRRVSLRSYYQNPVKSNAGKSATGQHQRSIHKPPPILSKDVTFKMCTALRECLQTTESLESLNLQGIPLKRHDVQALAKGLSKTRTLQHLSIEYCRISHSSVVLLCQAIHSSPCVKSINLTGCGITKQGAESISKLIRHQSTSRHSEAWKDSLRYRRPNLDQMPGLRRITLNNNPLINDSGAISLADALKDDLWLKALDMQHCGISNTGAVAMLEALRGNTSVVVLDIRRNPLVDHSLLKDVIEQVLINGEGREEEYPWLTATSMDPPQKIPTGTVKKKRKGRKKESKPSPTQRPLQSKSSITLHKETKRVTRPGAGFIPWRSAARAEERQRSASSVPGTQPATTQSSTAGAKLGSTVHVHRTPPRKRPSPDSKKASSVVIEESSESDGDETTTKDETTSTTSQMMGRRQHQRENKEMLVRLEELERRLALESKARAAADAQILELTLENSRLRRQLHMVGDRHPTLATSGSMLDIASAKGMDEDLLRTIEQSFRKFHSFLDLLRDAGLGQLCSLVGLTQTELQNPAVASILKDHQPTASVNDGFRGRGRGVAGFQSENEREGMQYQYPATKVDGDSEMMSGRLPSRTRPTTGHISVFPPATVTSSGSHVHFGMPSDNVSDPTAYPVTSSASAVEDRVGGTHEEDISRGTGGDATGKVTSSVLEGRGESENRVKSLTTENGLSLEKVNRERNNGWSEGDVTEQQKTRTPQDDKKMRTEVVTLTDDGKKHEELENRNNNSSVYEEQSISIGVVQSPIGNSTIGRDPTLITPDALKSGQIPKDAHSFHALNPQDVTLPGASKVKEGTVQEQTHPGPDYSDDDFESSRSESSKIRTSTPEGTVSDPSREEGFNKSDELPSQVEEGEEISNNGS